MNNKKKMFGMQSTSSPTTRQGLLVTRTRYETWALLCQCVNAVEAPCEPLSDQLCEGINLSWVACDNQMSYGDGFTVE